MLVTRAIACVMSAAIAFGCSHTLTINNFPETPLASAFPSRPLILGVVNQGREETEGYVKAIARALQTQGSIARVVYPYAKGAEEIRVDAIAYITVNPEYRGAGTNFLVNFPGFLVFAPAWNGYKYQANPQTTVEILDRTGREMADASWEHNYIFHQADIGRTWTQLSWLEYGVIALIGGIVFVRYDTDQTPHFIEAVDDDYGSHVAAAISEALAGYDRNVDRSRLRRPARRMDGQSSTR